jgi:hypothetical protein
MLDLSAMRNAERLFGDFRNHRWQRWSERLNAFCDYCRWLMVIGFLLYVAWWLLDAEYALKACHR